MSNGQIAAASRRAAELRTALGIEAALIGHDPHNPGIRQLAMQCLQPVHQTKGRNLNAALRPPYSERDESGSLWVYNVPMVADPLGLGYWVWVAYFAAVEGLCPQNVTRIYITQMRTEVFFDGQSKPSLLIDGASLKRAQGERKCATRLLRAIARTCVREAALDDVHVLNAQRAGKYHWRLCVLDRAGRLQNL